MQGEFERYRLFGGVADEGCEAAARLFGDKFRFASHVAGERIGVLVAYATGELDAGVGIQAIEGLWRKLRYVLMRGDDADVLLAGLFEDHGEIGIGRQVILAFVDVDETRQPLVAGGKVARSWAACAMQGEEEPAENFGALLLRANLWRC